MDTFLKGQETKTFYTPRNVLWYSPLGLQDLPYGKYPHVLVYTQVRTIRP